MVGRCLEVVMESFGASLWNGLVGLSSQRSPAASGGGQAEAG